MTADRDAGPMNAHHIEATRGDRHLHRCRVAGVEPALGLAMDLAPLNGGVLLLIGETTASRVCWIERAGMAFDVRGPETEVHYEPSAFRMTLGLKRLRAAPADRRVRQIQIDELRLDNLRGGAANLGGQLLLQPTL